MRETKCLLKCYLAHKDEFVHHGKKRLAYTHVLEDMITEGFTVRKEYIYGLYK